MNHALCSVNRGQQNSSMHELLFRLRSVEMVRGDQDKYLKQQLVYSYALIVVTRGEIVLELEQQQIELDKNSVYICQPDHTLGSVTISEDAELILFYFDAFQVEASNERSEGIIPVKEMNVFPAGGKMTIHPSDRLIIMSDHLYRSWHNQNTLDQFRCQIDFQEILYYVVQHCCMRPGSSSAALEVVKQYIEEHFTESLSIQQLAQLAGLSSKYFVDVFKRKYGKSAMELVAELRLQYAKRLMAASGARLRDIAHAVGYSDELYFSRKFKKEIGLTPTAYMKQKRRKLLVYSPSITGQLLPLGVIPYAAPLHPKWTEYYYREYRNEIPVHISAYRHNQEWRANIEHVKQMPVDLILTMDQLQEEEKNMLEGVAPVFYLPTKEMNWRTQFLLLADALGESWQASKWLQEYERVVCQVKDKLQRILGEQRIVILRMRDDEFSLYCNPGMAGLLYHDLGVRPAYESETDIYNIPVTLEELNELDPDYIFMMIRQDTKTLEKWNMLNQGLLWQSLRAVRCHRTFHITSDPWREYSAHAHERMLKQLCALLLEPEVRP